MKITLLKLSLLLGIVGAEATAAETGRPNFVIIFADDLGYGDLGCFGHPTIATPHLDRMAAEGMKLTQFYAADNVCTPSRAGLLTGRLPVRNGMCSEKRRVLFPDSGGGLPASEVTLAEALKEQGYTTACIGKWHLGHLPQFLPTSHGFDSYFGIPYSNDMDRAPAAPAGRAAFLEPKTAYWNVPLLRNAEVIERPADQQTITRRYTEEAIRFIEASQDRPFFLYLPHNLPHVPLFRGEQFANVSKRGLYGDVIEEIDWSVGQVLDTLRKHQLDKNTLVVFTSDNGPWLTYNEHGGSAGLLRDGKGCTWEGGMRVPALAWWPGTIPAGKVSPELGTTLDLFPTFVTLAGGKVPADRILDGLDLSPVLKATGPGPRETVPYYRGTTLWAFRKGPWKIHFQTRTGYGNDPLQKHDPPLLFHLEHDPGERQNLNQAHPDIVADLIAEAEQHRQTVTPVPSQLEIPLPKP